jgi:hypothetical protein
MTSIFAETEDSFDLGKEQRTERLGWVFYGVLAMVFVLGTFFLRERVKAGVLHACGLTILCYGSVLYVHDIEYIRELWLWKGVFTTIPLHLAFVYSLFLWDARFPRLAHSGFVFAYALWVVVVVEMIFILPIFEHFRSSSVFCDAQHNEVPPRPKGPLSHAWQAAADRLRGKLSQKAAKQHHEAARITIAGEEDFRYGERGKRELPQMESWRCGHTLGGFLPAWGRLPWRRMALCSKSISLYRVLLWTSLVRRRKRKHPRVLGVEGSFGDDSFSHCFPRSHRRNRQGSSLPCVKRDCFPFRALGVRMGRNKVDGPDY